MISLQILVTLRLLVWARVALTVMPTEPHARRLLRMQPGKKLLSITVRHQLPASLLPCLHPRARHSLRQPRKLLQVCRPLTRYCNRRSRTASRAPLPRI